MAEWTLGRVNIESLDNYKIVITTKRSNKFLGYVAIDDFEYLTDYDSCSTLPDIASPTSPKPPTTTNAPGGI